ncbi:hypothetical protein Hanom_Chr17g01554391 [Helianthus anomalus]
MYLLYLFGSYQICSLLYSRKAATIDSFISTYTQKSLTKTHLSPTQFRHEEKKLPYALDQSQHEKKEL